MFAPVVIRQAPGTKHRLEPEREEGSPAHSSQLREFQSGVGEGARRSWGLGVGYRQRNLRGCRPGGRGTGVLTNQIPTNLQGWSRTLDHGCRAPGGENLNSGHPEGTKPQEVPPEKGKAM